MITIFEMLATNFDGLGLGALLPTECTIQEELNGIYELSFYHPYDEWGKWRRIDRGRIVCAPTPRHGMQPFRIYHVNPTLDGVKVNARHIFYDLLDNSAESITTSSAEVALVRLKNALSVGMPFVFSTDIQSSARLTTARGNPVQALIASGYDEETQSFVEVYGGELERNVYEVRLLKSIGEDRNVVIRYGKNLAGLNITEDDADVKTRIIGYGRYGYRVVRDSNQINNYPYPKILVIEDENATASEITARVQRQLDEGIDIPSITIKVDFVTLAKTKEYAKYAALEQVFLGDTVTVINDKMGFSKAAKVVGYEYDCIKERYAKVTLGNFLPSIIEPITSGAQGSQIAASANSTASRVQKAITGNITITDDTLYIAVDNIDYTQSERVFRWSPRGLEFTAEGISSGTWQTLITPDGEIVQQEEGDSTSG